MFGKKFPKYTKAYKNFKGQSNVDLRLSSEMLDTLDLIKSAEGSITLGWKNKTQREKAEGNILGSYGREPNPAKARRFLGISKSELSEIISGFVV